MSTTTETHLALPTEADLEAARAALQEAVNRVGKVRFFLDDFFRLEELGERGSGMYVSGDAPAYESFDVPSLEDVGRLFVFEQDVVRLLAEIEEDIVGRDDDPERARFSDVVSWLDVVRQAGGDGRVPADVVAALRDAKNVRRDA
jgi:hypothetical protein